MISIDNYSNTLEVVNLLNILRAPLEGCYVIE